MTDRDEPLLEPRLTSSEMQERIRDGRMRDVVTGTYEVRIIDHNQKQINPKGATVTYHHDTEAKWPTWRCGGYEFVPERECCITNYQLWHTLETGEEELYYDQELRLPLWVSKGSTVYVPLVIEITT